MQTCTSKATSINKTKLPAIFKKIDWEQFRGKTVLDIGCGRYTEHIEAFLEQFGVEYVGFDPYWKPEFKLRKYGAVICSNVLNVIDDYKTVEEVHGVIRCSKVPFFITVYEGDRSGRGRKTGPDQYQRNEKAITYLWLDECLCKGVITKPLYADLYLK